MDAEAAYYGLLHGFKQHLNDVKIKKIAALDHVPTEAELHDIMSEYVRSEKVACKDIKLRTFITEGNSRNDLASHVYDVTYENTVWAVSLSIALRMSGVSNSPNFLRSL